ncbi:SagB/ThcOx family dehydrogenase [Nocardia panacis]|uniref:SagB/ThcOx family dehydrogenase n=1 Tax=Nocardia panacis TaxID=2340916 RepID=A0A3A4JRA9_9NOCA|nr:SagB family peptide dehydrogenase [Nocardia panacis]RJO72049.1 SagB/ThcOx family dehydrogenase [Nocardia panacis]
MLPDIHLRYALRAGATCLTVPTGAVLLNPPHKQQLSRLRPDQLTALKALNRGPVAGRELSAAGFELIDRLAAQGWLSVTVQADGHDLYTIAPFGRPTARPASAGPIVLSKFAILHRDSDGFRLEHPLSWCDLAITDARVLTALGGGESGLPDRVMRRLAVDLAWGGFTVADPEVEAREFTTRSWSAPDLWFHRRSTLGERTVTWEHFGPTKWAKPEFPQPPARRADYPGTPIMLPVPDMDALRAEDPTLTSVLEDRVSTRAFDDVAPIDLTQLSELLYRTARTKGVRSGGENEELSSRPYPSGGSLYELEMYPVVRHVAGLAPAMYHYDSFDHALRPVADTNSPAVQRLIKSTAATLDGGAQPQLLIVIAARAGRMMWTYEQIAYAAILKHVGALMQTVYLAATAMGLGVCAQGFGDTAAFTDATGVDELEECSVGSIIVGTPR